MESVRRQALNATQWSVGTKASKVPRASLPAEDVCLPSRHAAAVTCDIKRQARLCGRDPAQTTAPVSVPPPPAVGPFSLICGPMFIYFLFCYCLFLRERESRGGAERGRHGIRSRLQAPSHQHRA